MDNQIRRWNPNYIVPHQLYQYDLLIFKLYKCLTLTLTYHKKTSETWFISLTCLFDDFVYRKTPWSRDNITSEMTHLVHVTRTMRFTTAMADYTCRFYLLILLIMPVTGMCWFLILTGTSDRILKIMSVLVFLKFWHFSPERPQTGSLGATESK